MPIPPLQVLYEDNHLLVVVKPAGLPTMGVAEGKPTLLAAAKEYVRQRYAKPGNVYLGVVSRLDAPVTGVVLLARTSKAARRLTAQFRDHLVEKTYWAVVEGKVAPAAAGLIDWIAHDERHRSMHVVEAHAGGAKEARLAYHVLKIDGGFSLLEIGLETGRKHQIRLQLAHRGYPVVGDRKYGSMEPFRPGIALHARRLVVQHPVRPDRMEFVAPVPPSWRSLGIDERSP